MISRMKTAPKLKTFLKFKKQVRLSRATLEFQVLQLPTGLKVLLDLTQLDLSKLDLSCLALQTPF